MEMVRIAGGLSYAEFDATPHIHQHQFTSPLKHDEPMIDGSLRLVWRGQPVIVSFTPAAMAPVTMARGGAIAGRGSVQLPRSNMSALAPLCDRDVYLYVI